MSPLPWSDADEDDWGSMPARGGGCHRYGRVSHQDVRALAELLLSLAGPAEKECLGSQLFARFHAIHPPQIDIVDYLTRLMKHFKCSCECYVVAWAYIDRLLRCQPDFTISALTLHRLSLTSLVLAVKFTDDVILSNSWYAQVGGVTTQELNALEANFLEMLSWRAHVSQEEYERCHGMLRCMASPWSRSPGSRGGAAKRAWTQLAEEGTEPEAPDTQYHAWRSSQAAERASSVAEVLQVAASTARADIPLHLEPSAPLRALAAPPERQLTAARLRGRSRAGSRGSCRSRGGGAGLCRPQGGHDREVCGRRA
mmetsp:Transcript_30285/g.96815  ORF Transcript_30285/g.96815 Transcript_30285/m.96815 type:complete len:312 (-) Transcript_30285:155-1090(-)